MYLGNRDVDPLIISGSEDDAPWSYGSVTKTWSLTMAQFRCRKDCLDLDCQGLQREYTYKVTHQAAHDILLT